MPDPTPSPEAVEAAAVSWYEKKYGTKTFCLADAAVQTACRETVLPILESALPIELEKARARWETEVRERDANLRATAQNVINAFDNPSPGPEKWDRLREKINYLREVL